MLAAFEKKLANAGITQVFLQTGPTVPARRFYAKLGYEELALVSLAKRIDA